MFFATATTDPAVRTSTLEGAVRWRSAEMPLLDVTAECDRPPTGKGTVWLAMVGLDTWVYRLLINAALGTLALELASLVEQAQDRLNIGLNPAVRWR